MSERNGLGIVADVREFLDKYDVPQRRTPGLLADETMLRRLSHITEELAELTEGMFERDVVKQADALIDITYLCVGTALMMGLPVNQLWDEVHRANMDKTVDIASGERRRAMNIVKPAGWRPPDLETIINAYRPSNPGA